jgi:hypothetical protein
MTATESDIWADGSVDIQGANREFGLRRSRAYELMDSGKLPYSMATGRRLIPRRAIIVTGGWNGRRG